VLQRGQRGRESAGRGRDRGMYSKTALQKNARKKKECLILEGESLVQSRRTDVKKRRRKERREQANSSQHLFRKSVKDRLQEVLKKRGGNSMQMCTKSGISKYFGPEIKILGEGLR